MAPGTKRIVLGGVALALVAWAVLLAWSPTPVPDAPPVRDANGLSPIPEVATTPRPRTAPLTDRRSESVPAAGVAHAPVSSVLAGCFRGQVADGGVIAERYKLTATGTLEGELEETAPDGSGRFSERMRIAYEDGAWRYHPAPGGEPASVHFVLVEQGAGRLRFENPTYDYPQVIEYRRDGDVLTTRVAGEENGERKEETYSTRAEPCR